MIQLFILLIVQRTESVVYYQMHYFTIRLTLLALNVSQMLGLPQFSSICLDLNAKIARLALKVTWTYKCQDYKPCIKDHLDLWMLGLSAYVVYDI